MITLTSLEQLLATDPGDRGVAALQVPGDLERAAGALAGTRRALILTGFAVGPRGAAETDGPPGALFLGRALAHLGTAVALATHPSCEGVVAAGMEALALRAPLELLAHGEGPEALFERHRPDVVIAVELPGRAADGEYYSMRGIPLTERITRLDGVLPLAFRAGVPTIAIGDGGNEAGMGKVRERVQAAIPGGERIASVIPADCLIAAGTSNWGAYGLIAALDPRLLHDPEDEARLLAVLVAAGSLDGVTLQPDLTVDGIGLPRYTQMLTDLRTLSLRSGRSTGPTRQTG